MSHRSARFGSALETLRQRGICRSFRLLSLPGSRFPWTDTGLDLQEQSAVSLLAEGSIQSPPPLDLSAGARFHLWRRIHPGGVVCKGTQDTTSFIAERPGRLELGICHGEWKTPAGEIDTPPEVYARMRGGLEIAAVVWAPGVSPRRGLEALRQEGGPDPLVESELARLAHPVMRPPGWSYLWFLGESDTFSHAPTGHAIACRTRDDVAILRREVDLPAPEGTSLVWRWRVDRLPSRVAEDALLQHDYLSIAVEWDCGRDISYLWSSRLPEETVFRCPIPQWTPRETHVVVRSGDADLGRWCDERRDVHADYRRILGSEPGRIAAVWLIAVSLFQHGEGRAEFEAITLEAGGKTLRIG